MTSTSKQPIRGVIIDPHARTVTEVVLKVLTVFQRNGS